MSNQENIIHASSSPEDAETEIRRFFRPEELFPRTAAATPFINSTDELGIPASPPQGTDSQDKKA